MVWMEYLEMIPSSINRPQNIVCTRSGLIFKNKCNVSVRYYLMFVEVYLFCRRKKYIHLDLSNQSVLTKIAQLAYCLPVTARF